MALVAALLMLLLVCANYLLHRDVMYPGFLQAALWFVAVTLLAFFQGMFLPITDGVFVLLSAGVVLFGMGAFLGSYNHTPHRTRNYIAEGTLPSRHAVAVLAAVVLVGLVFYVARVIDLGSSGPSNSAFVNLRYATTVNEEETGGIGRVSYFLTLSYVLAAVVILKRHGLPRPALSRVLVGLTLLLGVAFGVLSSGRGPLLALMVVVLAIPTVLRRTHPAKIASVLVLLTLILFAVVGLALGKGGTLGNTLSENWSTMRESFLTYAVSEIPALGMYLDNRGPDVELGLNTFRSIVALLQTLGFQTTAAPLVQPYIDVPMSTNAYTIYHPYIKDFGPFGAAAVLFVLGFSHAALYRRATVRNPHALFVFLFAISLFPLVMQVFQDMYFSLLSMWIQYGTYAVLLFVVFSERRYDASVGSHASGELPPAANPV
jgi:oligosaccharide repeat unit polymerase